MSNYETVKDICIDHDAFLLGKIQEQCRGNQIAFITSPTSGAILGLKDEGQLLYKIDDLNNLWKQLITDAIIFLKQKDTREEYHDSMTMGTEKLCNFLTEFQKFEPILYGAVNNYRDHIAHVFRVYFLGQYLITKAIGFKNISIGKCENISKQEKEAMWCIIALTHDLGTAFEKILEINKKVRGMLQEFGNITVQELGYSYFTQYGPFSEFVVKFISSDIAEVHDEGKEQLPGGQGGNKAKKFTTHIQSKYYQKFLAALGNFNHGVMSSIILMKELVFFKESDYKMDQTKSLVEEDARQFMIRREILRSVASHSCDDIYYLKINNFPFLLTVCDEMQEWGRPRLVDVLKRGESSTKLTINSFNHKVVDYRVTFDFKSKPSEQEIENAHKEIIKYCLAKRNKWQNVLRSAVSLGTERELTLNFEVEDGSVTQHQFYSLKHTNPRDVKLSPESEKLEEELKPKKVS
ncbi:MAG: hypothetical protein ABSD92_00730 [Candidatus Bathyarchaeia archaeon]|jgi:hypothetical protein